MASYVDNVLQPGEQVRHTAQIHWIIYFSGFVTLIVSLGVLYAARIVERGQGFWLAVASVIAVIAAIMILRAWFIRWITEIAVTNRRLIFKRGFIARNTNEMQIDKVESVKVDQSIVGRIFDYGDLTVLGTGKGEFTRLKTVAGPIELRNKITGV